MFSLNKITAQKDGTGKSDVQIRYILGSLSNTPLISRNILVSLSNSPLIPHTQWVERHPCAPPIQLRYLKPTLVPFPKLSGAYWQASLSTGLGFAYQSIRSKELHSSTDWRRASGGVGAEDQEEAMDWPAMAARACWCGCWRRRRLRLEDHWGVKHEEKRNSGGIVGTTGRWKDAGKYSVKVDAPPLLTI